MPGEWVRLLLRRLASHDEAQGRCFCHTESQIPLGGTEEFGLNLVWALGSLSRWCGSGNTLIMFCAVLSLAV